MVYGSGRALWSSRSGKIPAPQFGDGTWRVGTQIPAGTYRMRADARNSCYWERLSGFSGAFGDVISNEYTQYHDVVTIAPGDAGFSSQRCGTWTQDLSPLKAPTAPTGNGTWIVGIDLAPGLWHAAGGSSCYWQRLSGFSGSFADVISNDFGPSGPTDQISDSDRGFSTEDCGTWTKVG